MTFPAKELIERAWSIRRDALDLDSESAMQLVLSSKELPLLSEAIDTLRQTGESFESSDPEAAYRVWVEARDLNRQLNILEGVAECQEHIARLNSNQTL